MTGRSRAAERLRVGVSDHGGWAVLVTVTSRGGLVDRRRVELVDAGLPALPHHHEGQKLPLEQAVALVAQVRASAERLAERHLEELAASVPALISTLALRVCPPLPATVEERIRDYRAMCVADWVMYRLALAAAAEARGWAVHWFEPKRVFEEAAKVLKVASIDPLLSTTGKAVGAPWQKDHKLAMAAAIAGARRLTG